LAEHRRAEQRLTAGPLTSDSHSIREADDEEADHHQPGHQRPPRRSSDLRLRVDPARGTCPDAGPRSSQGEPRPLTRAAPSPSKATRRSGGWSWIFDLLKEGEDHQHDTTYSPTKDPSARRRRVLTAPADQRTGGHGDGAGRGDEPVGGATPLLATFPGHQGHDRGMTGRRRGLRAATSR